jgi:hypothetical protein
MHIQRTKRPGSDLKSLFQRKGGTMLLLRTSDFPVSYKWTVSGPELR